MFNRLQYRPLTHVVNIKCFGQKPTGTAAYFGNFCLTSHALFN
jgi:hypothetical protein